MSLSTFRPVAMIASGLTTVGLISISPDTLPPAAIAGLLLLSFALMAGGLRRGGKGDSVSA